MSKFTGGPFTRSSSGKKEDKAQKKHQKKIERIRKKGFSKDSLDKKKRNT